MVVNKEINYKIRNNINNFQYFEYENCYITRLFVFSPKDLEDLKEYNTIFIEDSFEDGVAIMHHDFRKLNGILYSLKEKGLDCQAKNVDNGWLIQRKVSNWTPFIGDNYWISPCRNFRIEKLKDKRDRTYFKIIEIESGVYTESNTLEIVLEEYTAVDFYIRIIFVSKNYEKYRSKLKELL